MSVVKPNSIGRGLLALAVAALGVSVGLGLANPAKAEGKKFSVQGGAPVPYIAFIPIYVGQRSGLFAEEGLDVEIRYASGAAQATQITAAGQADVALITVEPGINGYEKGVRGKFIFQFNNQLIYWMAVPEDSSIRSLDQLKGKTVGVSNLGSSAIPVVKSMLRSVGIEPGPETILPVGVFDQAMAALKADKVQALGLFDGIYYGMERAGHKFRYFYHPTLAKFGNGAIFSADSTIAERPDDLCSFGRAFAKSVVFLLENPEVALRMWWDASPTARRGETEAEAIENGLVELTPLARSYDLGFPPSAQYGKFDRAQFQEYIGLIKEEGVINQAPALDDIVTDAFIDCINQFDAEQVRQRAREWKG